MAEISRYKIAECWAEWHLGKWPDNNAEWEDAEELYKRLKRL